jgi:hypothetical protein
MDGSTVDNLTVAPILPFTVMTRPMSRLPRTQAPIAILQLKPAAIIEEAVPKSQSRGYNSALPDSSHTNFPVGDGPSIGHPVSNIGTRAPRAFRRRDRVEVGIRCSWSCSKTAGLLVDSKRKATALDGSGMARLYWLSGERVFIGP